MDYGYYGLQVPILLSAGGKLDALFMQKAATKGLPETVSWHATELQITSFASKQKPLFVIRPRCPAGCKYVSHLLLLRIANVGAAFRDTSVSWRHAEAHHPKSPTDSRTSITTSIGG